jgi:hypothetical protein
VDLEVEVEQNGHLTDRVLRILLSGVLRILRILLSGGGVWGSGAAKN